MMRDQMNHLAFRPLFAPKAAVTDNTAQVSAIVDRLGFDALTLVVQTGDLADTDATFAVLVEDGDDAAMSDAAPVADDHLIGTEADAGFTFADDGETRKVGYVGGKRYVRVTVTPAGNTGNVFLAGLAVLGRPHNAPVN